MGSFSKVTNFLRDVLLSENPQARPKEEVAELLHDDIPGMEVNHQDEPGFEVVTKVNQKFCSLLLPAHNQESCLLYTSPSPRDDNRSRMPSSA